MQRAESILYDIAEQLARILRSSALDSTAQHNNTQHGPAHRHVLFTCVQNHLLIYSLSETLTSAYPQGCAKAVFNCTGSSNNFLQNSEVSPEFPPSIIGIKHMNYYLTLRFYMNKFSNSITQIISYGYWRVILDMMLYNFSKRTQKFLRQNWRALLVTSILGGENPQG